MMQPSRMPAITGEWECTECGYVEEGNELHPPAKCPECGSPSEKFEFFSGDEDDDWETDLDDDDDIDEDDDLDYLDDDADEDDDEAGELN